MSMISCVMLAAGSSTRSLYGNKLLACLPDGVPVVRQVALTLLGAGVGELLVVTGHQSQLIEEALEGLSLRFVFASRHTEGMGHSLAAGVGATRRDTEAFLICPADLPWLQKSTVRDVGLAFDAQGAGQHVIPVQAGRRGHPVVLGAWLRGGLEALSGDIGARRLLEEEAACGRCHELCVSDLGIHRDVDKGLSLDGSDALKRTIRR